MPRECLQQNREARSSPMRSSAGRDSKLQLPVWLPQSVSADFCEHPDLRKSFLSVVICTFCLRSVHFALVETQWGALANRLNRASSVSFCWVFVSPWLSHVIFPLLFVLLLRSFTQGTLLFPGFCVLGILADCLKGASLFNFCLTPWAFNLAMFGVYLSTHHLLFILLLWLAISLINSFKAKRKSMGDGLLL